MANQREGGWHAEWGEGMCCRRRTCGEWAGGVLASWTRLNFMRNSQFTCNRDASILVLEREDKWVGSIDGHAHI